MSRFRHRANASLRYVAASFALFMQMASRRRATGKWTMTMERSMRGLGTLTVFATAAMCGGLLGGCSSGDDAPDGGTADGGKTDVTAPEDAASDGHTLDGAGPSDDGSDASSADAGGANGHVVISQIFGAGGSGGALFTHDFVELFNAHREPVSLRGWSLQYTSASGSGWFGATPAQIVEMPDAILQPGQYYLIALVAGASGGGPLPAPDFVDPTPINASATAGKLALVKNATPLGCNGGSSPCADTMLEGIVDLVGYGAADFYEGTAPAPAPVMSSPAALRAFGGCVDTDDNGADFTLGTPAPRNTASPRNECKGVDAGRPDRDAATDTVNDAPSADALSGKRIHDIQGKSHTSPLNGARVTAVPGVVTAVGGAGFYFQDLTPDADDATSEGLFVYTASAPAVTAGDSVLVSGIVDEFRPGCTSCAATASAYSNLTTTQIRLPTIAVLSSDNPLPAPVSLGTGAGDRRPPANVIDDDTTGNVELDSKSFDPANDGIDFYESLEGMRVAVVDAVATGPTIAFASGSREIPILPAAGAGAGLRTARGGIVISQGDFNPERLVLSNTLVTSSPDVNVGDKFVGTITGVIDYAFAKYNLLNTSALPAVVSGGISRETLALPERALADLDVASFNVENLDPSDPADKFARLAGIIVTNLKSPDLIAIEEIQDNSGATNDGTVDASVTFTMLAQAISTAGGPSYQFQGVNPEDGKDGGEPGGNIRVGFLYRTDRGLSWVDRPGAAFNTPNSVVTAGGKPSLAYSPGRIDPTNAAFSSSRKPLAAEFTFRGRTLFVIANHFNSKGGDQPLFGRFQPPTLTSEMQRLQQAQIVATFVSQILAIDSNAAIAVLGDLNDFEFSPPVGALKNAGLTALVETLPPNERYSYVYEGNAQTLDHLLVSSGLLSGMTAFDVVHVNAEFFDQASDHDPSVARFSFPALSRGSATSVRRKHPASER
jgi:predicted extracellular nuclease